MNYLKIKDDIDLKELEKFGFEYEDLDDDGESDIRYAKYVEINGSAYGYVCILVSTREISVGCEYDACIITNLVVIYDLIQAGLVEKVVRK